MADHQPFVTFFVPGAPRGKGRPRFASIGGFARVFTDKKTESYEDMVSTYGHKAMLDVTAGRRDDVPLSVGITAIFPITESWPKKRKLACIVGDLWPIKKPDADNIIKIVGDALNGVIWKDDSQIVALNFVKMYGDVPGVRISVSDW